MYKVVVTYGREKIEPTTHHCSDYEIALKVYKNEVRERAEFLALTCGRNHKIELLTEDTEEVRLSFTMSAAGLLRRRTKKTTRKYSYDGVELYTGKEFTDANGYTLIIIWCGPKRVKAVVKDHPKIPPTYTAHWHFVCNALRRGTLTWHLK